MAEQIQAIKTLYGGVMYRSRLEARWMVFFEQLGLIAEYEPIQYQHNGYLPDFFLPGFGKNGCLIEIKPKHEFLINALLKLFNYVDSVDPNSTPALFGVWGLPGAPCEKDRGSAVLITQSYEDGVKIIRPFLLHCAEEKVFTIYDHKPCAGWTETLEKAACTARNWRFS